jgi:hypothetical protein
LERTRLEKAAADCGFELSPELLNGSLVLRSAQFPEFINVQPIDNDSFSLHASVPLLLPTTGEPLKVVGWNALYQVLDKAAATARTMPNRIAQKFHLTTASMPKTTEAERWVVQRIGQNLFRNALLDYWQCRCCVTGLAVPELLRASHIKPWARCDSDEERLDVFNGLLLAPHLDALFDGGWVTFGQEGQLVVSAALPQAAMELLGIGLDARIHGVKSEHFQYLKLHRQMVFRETGMN